MNNPPHAALGHLDERTQAAVDRVIGRIVERFDPERILVFGSFARGTATADSDLDLLVVLRDAGSKHRAATAMYGAVGAVGLSKDFVVVTPEEFERFHDVPGTIIYPAVREGKTVYRRAA